MPNLEMPNDDAALEQRARRAARRVGLIAKKSRWHINTVDNQGGFMLIEPISNRVCDGERFDLVAQAVIDYCDTLK
jgi:hypothetical protein